jgi:hypothetical protein
MSPRTVLLALGLTALLASPAAAESWVLWSNVIPLVSNDWTADETFPTRARCFEEMSWKAHSFVEGVMHLGREVRKVDPDNYVRTYTVTRTGNRTTVVGTAPAGVQTKNRKLISYWECAPVGVTPR